MHGSKSREYPQMRTLIMTMILMMMIVMIMMNLMIKIKKAITQLIFKPGLLQILYGDRIAMYNTKR